MQPVKSQQEKLKFKCNILGSTNMAESSAQVGHGHTINMAAYVSMWCWTGKNLYIHIVLTRLGHSNEKNWKTKLGLPSMILAIDWILCCKTINLLILSHLVLSISPSLDLDAWSSICALVKLISTSLLVSAHRRYSCSSLFFFIFYFLKSFCLEMFESQRLLS